VLNVPEFHVVFPLPKTLEALALQHPGLRSTLLLRTVAATLLTIAREPTHLSAHIGFLALLHPWGQPLQSHPHLHCVVPGGGRAPDGTCWVPGTPNFFRPVKVLRRFLRRRFLEGLTQAVTAQTLTLTGPCQTLAQPQAWQHFMPRVHAHAWVVYAKRPMRAPAHGLTYLARSTHRGAITHRRLLALEAGRGTFRWRDYTRGNRQRIMTLDAVACLRRFLLHVLPRGFQHIRHYGFLAHRVREERLTRCRQLLQPSAAASPVGIPLISAAGATTAALPRAEGCPVCQPGRMLVGETLFPHRAVWDLGRPVLDTS
jgi:hypothetical protein